MLEITLLSVQDLSIAIEILNTELVQYIVRGLTITFREELDYEVEELLLCNVLYVV